MEFVGKENRIQALFRELRLKDEHITPRFAALWNRAQLRNARPRSSFRLAFVTATVLLAGALFSVAWWSRYRQGQQLSIAVATVPPLPSVRVAPATVNSGAKDVPTVLERRRGIALPYRRASGAADGSESQKPARQQGLDRRGALPYGRASDTARRQAELLPENRSISDAAAISSWQSPTTALLRSGDEEVLTSLPQLDTSSNELKSFLPGRSN